MATKNTTTRNAPIEIDTPSWRAQQTISEFVKTILGLSKTEYAVLDAICYFQMPQRAVTIAKKAGVNRKMTNRILNIFLERQLVIKYYERNRHDRWRFNRKVARLKSSL